MTRSAGPGIPRSGPLLAHDALRRTRGAGDCAEPVLGDLYMLKDLSFNGSRESPAFLNDLANSHEVLSLPPGTGLRRELAPTPEPGTPPHTCRQLGERLIGLAAYTSGRTLKWLKVKQRNYSASSANWSLVTGPLCAVKCVGL